MQAIEIGRSGIQGSRLAYGCMRIVGDGSPEAREKGKAAIRAALEAGYTHFDHADIYAAGASEELFAEVLREEPGLRDRIVLTSKCGIRRIDPELAKDGSSAPTQYDFSPAYITSSVESSLKRLGVECLDFLLLHRPDYLFRAEEVAQTFAELRDAGKVKHFGVSNFSPSQVSLLQSACDMPLAVNQIEINLHRISPFQDGTLDQCQELKITPQAWCPIAGVAYPSWWHSLSDDEQARLDAEVALQAERYGVEGWVVALAWLLKHPSDIVPIIGSTTPGRIHAATQALELEYRREDWYRLLIARHGNAQVP